MPLFCMGADLGAATLGVIRLLRQTIGGVDSRVESRSMRLELGELETTGKSASALSKGKGGGRKG